MLTEICGNCQHFVPNPPEVGNDMPKLPQGFGRCSQSVSWRFMSPKAPCAFNPIRFIEIPETPKFALE